MIRFRQHTLALFDLLHKETGQKYFNGLLHRAHRWAQSALGVDLRSAQGSMIHRSSLDAELHCVALIGVLALCRNHWIETFAARMEPLYGLSPFCALLHRMEIFAPRRVPLWDSYCPVTEAAFVSMDDLIKDKLERRLGPLVAQQRQALEANHERQIIGERTNSVIRLGLKLSGLYWRGRANAARVQVKENDIRFKRLPPAFDGFTLLHISDFHADMNDGAMRRLEEILPDLSYDICVLTGDYRGARFGKFDDALALLQSVLARIKRPVYGVLGNHDTIRMVPDLEVMQVRMLLNECEPIERGGAAIYLAGIDDAHYFHADNIEKAASSIPRGAFSVLLSHTPEVYRQAADAGFDLLLSGHTHGGQICLPGSIPITLHAVLPRRFGAGAWKHHEMAGYTSTGVGSAIVPVRFNCLPEITLHRLWRMEEGAH